MKELSIEEKAKAYDEAIERSKNYYSTTDSASDIKLIGLIFPELKESEGERIRKALIEACKQSLIVGGFHKDKAIAWLEKVGKIVDYYEDRLDECACKYFNKGYKHALEKQGEQNLVNTDLDELVIQLEETIGTSPHSRETIKDFFQMAIQKYMNCLRIANGEIGRLVEENYWLKEKQGEQKPVPKFKIGDTMRTLQEAKDGFTDGMPVVVSIDEEYYHCTNELIAIKDQDKYEYPPMNRRQKPVEWNEKIKGLDELETYVLSLVPDRPLDAVKVDSKNIRFLINKEQKPWSEEDEKMLNKLLAVVDLYYGYSGNVLDKQSCTSFLKSLKERYTWKPSDEQLQALHWVCNRTFIAQEPQKESVLEDLYEQLKAL